MTPSYIIGSEIYGPNIEDKLVKGVTGNTFLETIIICNTENADTTFSIRVGTTTTPLSAREYLYYNKTIEANDTLIIDLQVELKQGNYCYIKSTNGLVAFKAIGYGTA
jgi:hypothetical protein